MRPITIICLSIMIICSLEKAGGATYYFDSVSGSDRNPGSRDKPLRSLAKLYDIKLLPGDSVFFKRNSSFMGNVILNDSGEDGVPITFMAYGMGEKPRFSNLEYDENYGRLFDVSGSHIIFKDLFFFNCAIQYKSRRRAQLLGAIFMKEDTHHNTIIDCEFTNMPVGIRDNGDYGIIKKNYLHDSTEPLNRYWGPMGIVATGNYTEIAHNTFINIRSTGTFWGADGGAIELDNHENQTGLRVHHNFSRENSGFLECYEHGSYRDVTLAYNLSDDYEKFLGLNGTKGWRVINNTVIRSRHDNNGFSDFIWFREWYNPNEVVFINNIFITRDVGMSIFGDFRDDIAQDGEAQKSNNNLYYSFNGEVGVGKPLGDGDCVADPLFIDFDNRDLRLRKGSPAIDAALDFGYLHDLDGTAVTGKPDIGAYEYIDGPRSEELFNGNDLDDWIFFLGDKDETTDPGEVWEIRNGVIWCSGKTDGYIRTKKTYRNFKLAVEWRWPKSIGDSGILVRIYGADKRWPLCVEMQVGGTRTGDILAIDGELDDGEVVDGIHIQKCLGENKEREIGNWNLCEIACNLEQVIVSINGQEINRTTGTFPYQGHIGLQSGVAPIEYRKLRLMPLD